MRNCSQKPIDKIRLPALSLLEAQPSRVSLATTEQKASVRRPEQRCEIMRLNI